MNHRFRLIEEQTSTAPIWQNSLQSSPVMLKSRGPMEQYLEEIRHEAHRHLDAGRAEAIVAEVAEHLNQSVEAQVYDGIPRAKAEQEAIAGFGDAHHFLHNLLDCIHSSQRTPVVRTATLGIVSGMLTLALWQATLGVNPAIALFGSLLPLIIGSFWARKIEPVRYMVPGIALLAAYLLYVGLNTVPVTGSYSTGRNQLKREITEHQRNLQYVSEDISALKEGMTAFSAPSAPVSKLLFPKSKYLTYRRYVLLPPVRSDQKVSGSPFQWRYTEVPSHTTLFYSLNDGYAVRTGDMIVMPTNTTPDRAKAARTWQRYGPGWLARRQADLLQEQHFLAFLTTACEQPYRMNLSAMVQSLRGDIPLFAYIVLSLLLHLAAAWLGRQARVVWWRWLWRLRTSV